MEKLALNQSEASSLSKKDLQSDSLVARNDEENGVAMENQTALLDRPPLPQVCILLPGQDNQKINPNSMVPQYEQDSKIPA